MKPTRRSSTYLAHPVPILLVLLMPILTSAGETAHEPVTLRIGETAELEGHGVTFVEVDGDNRCPPDVQCIVAGQATVILRIRPTDDETPEPEELRIGVPPQNPGRARFTDSAGRDHELAVALEPETRSTDRIEPEEYFAHIVLDPPESDGRGQILDEDEAARQSDAER